MLPIRLRFEAFGSFAKQQDIDFTRFDSDRIFLICGNTGSGKTTIFDAITFCLYGTASGGVRDPDSFKSAFAEEGDLCWAEFTFLLRGKSYSVRREPIQYRRKRTGNLVKENSTAELTLEDGTILSGTQAVDAKLQELLGLSVDQFKKIVMLPQGEFRKFLSDDSAEKQKTLRNIFSTELLADFTERLRLNAADARQSHQQAETAVSTLLDTVAAEEGSPLAEALAGKNRDGEVVLALLREDCRRRKQEEKDCQKQLAALLTEQSSLHPEQAREQNENLARFAGLKEALAALEGQRGDFDRLAQTAASLRHVRELTAYEAAAAAARSEAAALAARLEAGKKALAENDEKEHAAGEKYALLLQKQREETPLFTEQLTQKQQLLERAAEREAALRELSGHRQEQERLSGEAALLHTAQQAAALREQLLLREERLRLLGQAEDALNGCGRKTEAAFAANRSYKAAMTAFLDSQAYFLAQTLEEAQPCPVCGALSHPLPARQPQHSVTREQMDEAKAAYDAADLLRQESAAQVKQLLLSAGFSLASHERLSHFLPDLQAALAECGDRRAALRQQLELLRLPDRLAALSSEELGELAAQNETARALQRQRCSDTEERLARLEKETEGQNDIGAIREQIRELNTRLSLLSAAPAQAAAEKERLFGEGGRFREAIRQLGERISSLEGTAALNREKFSSLLTGAALTEEAYRSLLPQTEQLEETEGRLEEYRRALTETKAALSSLAPQIEGKTPVDLEALAQRLSTLEGEITALTGESDGRRALLAQNTAAEKRLANALQSASSRMEARARLERLSDVANGKYSDRVNFERYVLAGYFSEVIENANERLYEMTNGRYTLRRRAEREKGSAASGLALEVIDANNGQARHVNTLSGGESFQISLALALGLADIVSQRSGGIELSTMFIDEGFGSLDPHALDHAVECLQRLKNTGRYIGIISHVSELREKIPARINVREEPQGSRIEIEV